MSAKAKGVPTARNVMFRRHSAAPVFGWFAPPPQPKRRHYKATVKGKMHAPRGGALDCRLVKNPLVFLPLRLFCGKGLLFGRLPPVARANGKASTNDTPKTPARGALKIKGGQPLWGSPPFNLEIRQGAASPKGSAACGRRGKLISTVSNSKAVAVCGQCLPPPRPAYQGGGRTRPRDWDVKAKKQQNKGFFWSKR